MSVSTNGIPSELIATYFVVWVTMAVGSWLFEGSLGANEKKRLHSRVLLINIVVIGGFLAAMMLVAGSGLAALVILPVSAVLFYLNATRNRLCMQCNRNVMPTGFAACEFCPRCGATTVEYDSLFSRAD
jgi:hypothetical protein